MKLFGQQNSSAALSEDGAHRYWLDRVISDNGPCYVFIGVNPSTADANADDATIRRLKGFVARWSGAKFIIVNLYSKRATDVRELAKCDEPIRQPEWLHRRCLCQKKVHCTE